MPFWEHFDVLRAAIIKTAAVAVVFAVLAFCMKDKLFDIVLAPKSDSFVTYRLLDHVAALTGNSAGSFKVSLINTGLAQQFIIHMKTALCMGVVLAAPYILYQLFRFVSPALYENERSYATRLVSAGYLMFMTGMAVSYFLIFPLTFRFLGTYQVDTEVSNMISLESYMSTLITMSLMMGLMFELPVLLWLLGKMGLVSASRLRRYRKHALVAILIAAAVITPTSDIFTLLITSMPVYILFEAGILIVACTESKSLPQTSTV